MIKSLNQAQMKRLYAVHGWSGVVLGLLLYAVVLTGTLAVLSHEIAVWSVGGRSSGEVLLDGLDGKVRPYLDRLSKGYLTQIGIGTTDRGDIRVVPRVNAPNPKTGEPDEYGIVFILDGRTGELRQRREGFLSESAGWFGGSALKEFIIDLHVRLHAPAPWGYVLTGALGLAMMLAGVTGLLMHRRLVKDLFVPDRPGERLVSYRDRHALASTWSLPFAFLLGFTGSFLSFAISVGIPLMAIIAFSGDQQGMMKALRGMPGTVDETRVETGNLDRIIADARERAGAPIRDVWISNYARADADIRVFSTVPEGGLLDRRFRYHGATGAFLEEKPVIGTGPSIGGALVGLLPALHFGYFADLMSKFVWLGLGGAMAYVVMSGLKLWVRRRQQGPSWRHLGRAIVVVGYGLPIGILSSAYGFFVSVGSGADEYWWTPASFIIGLVFAVMPGVVARADDGLRRLYRLCLAAGLLLLPVTRMTMGGLDWVEAAVTGQLTVLLVDIALLMVGAFLIVWDRSLRRPGASEFEDPVTDTA